MKLHTDVIDYYISQSRNVDANSLKKYGRSIADFIAFDPTLNQEKLNNLVKHKLFEFEDGTQSQAEFEKIFRQSTQHITKFIKILYKDDMLKYNILPNLFFLHSSFRALSTLTLSNLYRLYIELFSFNLIWNVIINLIYSLRINVTTLCNIRFSVINLHKIVYVLWFWVNDVREVLLSNDLYNEIMYY